MRIIDFLEKSKISYEVEDHPVAFSAQTMAAVIHEPGKYVAKPVLVKADGKFLLCVLPAHRKIDLQELKNQVGAKSIEIAGEDEIGKIFPDCELGAEPPFGNLYNVTTIMDKSLEKDDHIIFQAGSHEKAVRMSMADFKKLVNPCIMEFTYQV